MYKIDEIKMLRLGQRDENLARSLPFDCSDWLEQYPEASIHILFRRPGESAIVPMSTTLEGTTLTWLIHDFEVGKTGVGNAEFRAVDTAGLRRKSRIIPCSIEETLLGDDETVLYTQDQVDETLAHISEAAQAAQAAKASEEAAALSASEAGESAASAGTAADVAVSARDAAQAAQIAAETAQHQAESAQSGVHADAEAAEQAKVAAQAAQASAQGAASQASADRTAAESARTDAEAAAEHAEAVVEGIDRAGADQVAAVNAAGQAQVAAVNTAGATQVGNVNTAGTTQVNAVQAKGTQVIASIPADYSQMSTDVTNLKSAVSELESFDNAPVIINTASGSVASFDDGAEDRPMKSLVAHIEPVQDLHGYDNPWPAGGGKNKFNTDFSDRTINGTVITKLSDGKVSTSGVPTSAFDLSIGTVTLPAGNYILNGCPAGGGANKYRLQVTDFPVRSDLGQDSGSGVSFTLSEEMVVAIRIQMYTGASASLTFAPMIRLASETDATFSPYSNICPISGWTRVKASKAGKNLWGGTLSNGVDVVFDTKPGQTYTASAKLKGTKNCYLYVRSSADGFQTNELVGRILNAKNVETVTFTAEARKEYALWSNASYMEADQIQLELGTTATDYEPYAGNIYDITLPTEAGTVYGGTLDVVKGVLTVDRAMVDLGTLDWSNEYVQRYSIFIAKTNTATVNSNKTLCSAYLYSPLSVGTTRSDKTINVGNSYFDSARRSVTVKDTSYTDVTVFKTAMSGIQLVYELANPVAYQLTPQEVKTLLGQNNVWADTGDVDVTYQADTKLYIEQLTKPTEDDMKANTAITSGKFFMIGNRLFLATAAISLGATIIPGTNCTELSLADALNNINA